MVVAAEVEAIDGFKYICPTVAIGIGHFGQLTTLGAIQGAVFVSQAQHLVQPFGVQLVMWLGAVDHVRVLDDPDLSPTGGNRQSPVGHGCQTTYLQFDVFGDGYGFEEVIILFREGLACLSKNAQSTE